MEVSSGVQGRSPSSRSGGGQLSPPEDDNILGLKVYFTQNASTISYLNITHSCHCLITLLNAFTSANIYNLKRSDRS